MLGLGALCLAESMKHESIGEGEFQHFVVMVLYDFSMVVCMCVIGFYMVLYGFKGVLYGFVWFASK